MVGSLELLAPAVHARPPQTRDPPDPTVQEAGADGALDGGTSSTVWDPVWENRTGQIPDLAEPVFSSQLVINYHY